MTINKTLWPDITKDFPWNNNSRKAAELLADGYNNRETGEEIGITITSIANYRRHPEFMEKVVSLTLTHEKASIAGLLNLAFRALDVKGKGLSNDKTTQLDFMKFIQGISPGIEEKEEKRKVTIEVL